METNLSYEAAYKELSQIASEINGETISIDLLGTKVQRAAELIAFCQGKLRATQDEVTKIIQQMEQK
jgi:exodeoxyribonuclease VII small subunit